MKGEDLKSRANYNAAANALLCVSVSVLLIISSWHVLLKKTKQTRTNSWETAATERKHKILFGLCSCRGSFVQRLVSSMILLSYCQFIKQFLMVHYLPHQTFHQYMCVPDKCSVVFKMLFRGFLFFFGGWLLLGFSVCYFTDQLNDQQIQNILLHTGKTLTN